MTISETILVITNAVKFIRPQPSVRFSCPKLSTIHVRNGRSSMPVSSSVWWKVWFSKGLTLYIKIKTIQFNFNCIAPHYNKGASGHFPCWAGLDRTIAANYSHRDHWGGSGEEKLFSFLEGKIPSLRCNRISMVLLDTVQVHYLMQLLKDCLFDWSVLWCDAL